ncbi:MAG TPA: hypothetical protein VIF62_21540 [Labilithrix sp.]|jgi:hypothetical protein
MKRRWKIVGGGAAGIVALVGLMHLPSVQAMMGASCPFGRPPDPAKLEALRTKTAANLRGATSAPARPALGFVLDASKKPDVLAWGARAGATCEAALGDAALRCEHAKVDDGPLAADAFFRFAPDGRLVAVDVMREPQPADDASAAFERLVADRSHELGNATRHGDASGASLASAFARADATYRFTDYSAEVSVTNLGERGIVVREQYRSLR